MAGRSGSNWWSLRLLGMVYLALALVFVSAQEILEQQPSSQTLGEEVESNDLIRASKFLSHTGGVAYKHVWPEMRFGWKIAVGTIIGFLGAAFGSVGGVGGGGFFVPMLTLIIGFDQKSSTAISKCMITSGAAATVFYNLRLRHPTLELPLIDYDLALLFQPMLVLGISIGVSLNVVLSEWMITILLIIVLLGTSTRSFFRGVETWKKETITKKNLLDASKSLQSKGAGSEDITIPGERRNSMEGVTPCPSSAPGLILMELKQAKLNLTRTTTDLADIRASVESFNKKLEKERIMLEKTRVRLTSNSLKVLSLEEELKKTKLNLQLAKDAETKGGPDNSLDISKELHRLSSETEQFKRMAEVAKSEVVRATSEIEQTRTKIKTAEIRLVAARKMKEAARAVEAVALAEIKALSYHESSSGDSLQKHDRVTLSFEEYSSLTHKVRDAEELSKNRVTDAMLHLDEANVSKTEILKKVEEATEEVKTTKKALEEALNRVETANKGKLAVEEALRKWRSQHGHKRRSVHNSTKFKNPHPSIHGRDLQLRDVNGLNLVTDGPIPVLRPTLSIGQILSRKLLLPEEVEMGVAGKSPVRQKMSLGQMLQKQNGDQPFSRRSERESNVRNSSAKRKKSGFARFSLLLTKQSRKKKKPTPNLK